MAEVSIDFENTEGLEEEVKTQLNDYAKGLVKSDWRKFVSEENGTHSSTATIQDLDALAKSYINAQGLIGKKGIIPPTDEDGEDMWNDYWTKLGRPEKPEEYEFEDVEGLEDIDFKDLETEFRDRAHKSGMSKKQANEAWKYFKEVTKNGKEEMNNNYKTKYNESWGNLKKEWGAAYPEKIKKVQALLSKFADEKTNEWIKSSGITKEAGAVKLLAAIADNFSEDKLEVGSHLPGAHSPAEALAKAHALMEKKSPYWDKKDPRHESTVKQVEALFLEAYPSEKK